jgi:hypothetical protein
MDHVFNITSTAQAGFGQLIPELREEFVAKEIICRHCGLISPGRVGDIDRVVVNVDYVPKTHSGVIGDVWYTQIMSNELYGHLGRERVGGLGRVVPVENYLGQDFTGFKCVLIDERQRKGEVRGDSPNEPSLCKECGRLRYWPGWPPDKNWYVLRRDLPDDRRDLFHMGFLLCTSELWERTIKPAKLKHIRAHRLRVLDEPTDGWPADYQALKDAVRKKGLLR